jgi:acyl carrier protein
MADLGQARPFPDTDSAPDAGPHVSLSAAASPVPPRTPHEEAVAAIWCDVLGRSDIGVLDDFFDLDGTSLQAISVVTRIRDTWAVQIRARDFFESPTVASLAAAVAARSTSGRPVIGRRSADAEPVLSFDQQQLWLEHQMRPGAAYNVHLRRRLIGPLDVAILERSIRTVISRHESLRTRFPTVDARPAQVVDPPDETWRIDFEDLSGVEGNADLARRRADEQAATPFDLAHGPLLRYALIKLGEADHVLIVTAHHIICDNWSIGLFVREFAALYEAGGDVDGANLPALPIQYRDYAVWQRQALASGEFAPHIDYWRSHLAGAPETIALPAAGRRTAADGGHGGRVQTVLSAQDAAAVGNLCRLAGVTPFMVWLAALSTVLSRWSGQSDMVIGVPITGRTDPGTENLIGFFVNAVPLRIDLSGDPTFADLIARVRQVALGAYAHADVPLDVLVNEFQLARGPNRTPLFQVLLNAIDDPGALQLRGLTSEEIDIPVPPSKFDIALWIRENGGIVTLILDFNADRHQTPMMRVLLDQLCALLRVASDDPSRGIHEYGLDA